jgi:prevent-host-death family protein
VKPASTGLSGLYAYDMREGANTVTIGVQEARQSLRDYIDAALLEGQRTIIERHGKPVAVLIGVPDADLLFALDDRPELRAELAAAATAETGSSES